MLIVLQLTFILGVIFSDYKKKFHEYIVSAFIGHESDFLLPRKLYLFLIS